VRFKSIAQKGHDAVLAALSAPLYPDGTPALRAASFYGPEVDPSRNLTRAKMAFWVRSHMGHSHLRELNPMSKDPWLWHLLLGSETETVWIAWEWLDPP
jgi:hypothetical protein